MQVAIEDDLADHQHVHRAQFWHRDMGGVRTVLASMRMVRE